MNVKNDISEELGSLSALVATISRETPYRAPEGYFLSFPTVVLERVQPSPIKTAREVPRVAGSESASWQTSPLGALGENSKPLTFSVPEGYFEGFAQQVLSQIKARGSGPSIGMEEGKTLPAEPDLLPSCLIQAGRITPYSVPEGYFDGLSPILAVLKDKNPYLVPAGYFAGLAAEVSSKTTEQRRFNKPTVGVGAEDDYERPKARVIGLGRRVSWMKYAAAAVVAGLIVTVGWLRWHPATPSAPQLAAVVPAGTPAEITRNLSRVSDAELQNFLVDQDTTLAQPVGNIGAMATVDMDDSNLKTLLGDVSDGELRQYMDEHGGASDIATN